MKSQSIGILKYLQLKLGYFQIWYDVANCLVKEEASFRLNEDSNSWEEKCLAFSSQQTHIQLDEVMLK